MRKIIVTADDFGVHPYIDNGIRKAVLAGCVNTVSAVMTFQDPSPKIKSLINDASNAGRPLNVGVHITLTAGSPVLTDDAFTLTYDGGKFMDIMSYDYAQVDPLHVYNEVKAQVEKFKAEVGINPDHLTCHNGIMHLFPDYFKLYLKVATEYGIPIRKPVLMSTEKVKGFRLSFMKAEGLYRGYRILRNHGVDRVAMNMVSLNKKSVMNTMRVFNNGIVKCPDYFIDSFYTNGTQRRLLKIMNNIPRNSTSELVLHLGDGEYTVNDQEQKKYNGINLKNFRSRERELDTIINKCQLGQMIQSDSRFQWVKFGDL